MLTSSASSTVRGNIASTLSFSAFDNLIFVGSLSFSLSLLSFSLELPFEFLLERPSAPSREVAWGNRAKEAKEFAVFTDLSVFVQWLDVNVVNLNHWALHFCLSIGQWEFWRQSSIHPGLRSPEIGETICELVFLPTRAEPEQTYRYTRLPSS